MALPKIQSSPAWRSMEPFLKIRQELVHGIGISVYWVKMELRKPLPPHITIAHYPVNVVYRGQVQQRFRCEQTGHLSRECPLKDVAWFSAISYSWSYYCSTQWFQ